MTDKIVPPDGEANLSSSLLVRVKSQDKAAWDRLVHLYTPLVYGWCRRAGLQEADALDVGQEIFQTVWRKIHLFHRERPEDTFRGWMRVLARHKIADHHRRKQGQTEGRGGSDALTRAQEAPAPELPDPTPEEDRTEAARIYHRAVALIQAEFAENTWLAFEAVVMRGQKPADVAQAFHMSLNAVYLARTRVLKRLRQEFKDLMES